MKEKRAENKSVKEMRFLEGGRGKLGGRFGLDLNWITNDTGEFRVRLTNRFRGSV